tara:strand:- start:258 stop:872 length:615 start_codon:yes stop_codon:yes gene_type:complete
MSELKLTADSGGGSVSLKGPASTTSNAAVQLTLPQNDGDASQYLQTNGSGALTWAAAGGGKVLKYAFHEYTTTTNISSTYSKTDIPGSSFSYTPTSASSKLIVTATTNVYSMATDNSYYADFDLFIDVDGTEEGEIRVYRGRNSTGNYETYWTGPETFVREFDSPGTSAVNIKMKSKRDNNGTAYCQINVNGKKSSIFVLEIST